MLKGATETMSIADISFHLSTSPSADAGLNYCYKPTFMCAGLKRP